METISQEDFERLESKIELKMIELEVLQRIYRSHTGRDYVMNLYLTDFKNMATLESNP